MTDYFLGEIRLFSGNYAPVDFLPCDGRSLSVSDNQPLFALIGTIWGGDGVTKFALPDLRGRAPIGQGSGPGLTSRTIGQTGGAETVALTDASMLPAHSHGWNIQATEAKSVTPTKNLLAQLPTGTAGFVKSADVVGTIAFSDTMCAFDGGNQSHTNMMPSLALTYMICTNGLYPSS
ncbi:MAG: tail fiber protein [Azospirillaceae bacterium]|nr:tail fiber protein [Azospirillaceae bacterium]